MQWGISWCIFCAFFVVETYCTECPREAGFCVTSSNRDINNGVFKVNGDNVKSAAAKEECLRRCLEYDRSTGCEVIWNRTNRGCYIHTSRSVSRGNKRGNHECWVLKKCKNVCVPSCSPNARCRRSKCECLQGYQGNGTFCEKSRKYNRCGGTISKSNVYIKYPFSGPYKYYKPCTWYITTPEPIIIKFKRLSLVHPCTQNLLMIKALNGTVLKKFGCRKAGALPHDYIPTNVERFRIVFEWNYVPVGASVPVGAYNGFEFSIMRRTCRDIGCHALATCHVAPPHNAPHCKCDPGHWGDGRFSCRAHDACSRKGIFCHSSASCYHRVVNYQCKCNTGWSGNGTYCYKVRQSNRVPTGSYFGMGFAFIFIICICQGGGGRFTADVLGALLAIIITGLSVAVRAATSTVTTARCRFAERSQTPPPERPQTQSPEGSPTLSPARSQTPPPTLQRSASTSTIPAGVTSEDGPILELNDLTNINDPPPPYQTFYDNHGADLSAGVTSEDEPILELSDLTNINDPPPAYRTIYVNHGADEDDIPPPSYEEAV